MWRESNTGNRHGITWRWKRTEKKRDERKVESERVEEIKSVVIVTVISLRQ